MRRVLANRLVLAVAALSVAVSTAFGAFVVLPVNDLVDAAHAASVADRADLALAVLRAGGTPTGPGLAVLQAPVQPAAHGVPSASDWARARRLGWRHDARSGRTAYAVRPVGDGRLIVVSAVRPGTFERRERLGLAAALATVLVGAMGVAVRAGTRHARRLARLARVARRIAAGDLSARAHDTGRDEIARLGADVDLMAERLGALERARGEFVAKVSHDLRTPVTVIKGYAYTLARRTSDPDVDRRLAAITREADRLAAQIDDLLTLSRSQAGALELVWSAAEVQDLLGDVAERAAAHADERGIALEVDGATFLLDGDHARLARAVTNLVQNAIRHAPAGSTVVLRAEADGHDAMLVVDDAGCGIAPERISMLVRPFATGDPVAGIGLGLAIVAEIAAAHGGTFSLEPRAAGGTSARIRLPGCVLRPAVYA
jgi:signal transduction histidine kinase